MLFWVMASTWDYKKPDSTTSSAEPMEAGRKIEVPIPRLDWFLDIFFADLNRHFSPRR